MFGDGYYLAGGGGSEENCYFEKLLMSEFLSLNTGASDNTSNYILWESHLVELNLNTDADYCNA